MQIFRNGSVPSVKGSPEWFTGDVRIDMMFRHEGGSPVTGAIVTFEPGARTAWHTHPVGQLLIVTEGKGWVQEDGRPAREIKSGDVVWIEAGVKHWHGAASNTRMSHLAIAYMQDGKSADWKELVSDEQYNAR